MSRRTRFSTQPSFRLFSPFPHLWNMWYFFFAFLPCLITTDSLPDPITEVLINHEVPAYLPGCAADGIAGRTACTDEVVMTFLEENLRLPHPLEGGKGIGVIGFIIAADGTLGVPTIERSRGDAADREMRRVARLLRKAYPRWVPGTFQGRPVATQLHLPVQFMRYREATCEETYPRGKGAMKYIYGADTTLAYLLPEVRPVLVSQLNDDVSREEQSKLSGEAVVEAWYDAFTFPPGNQCCSVSGLMVVRMVVDTNGRVGHYSVLRDIGCGLGDRAATALKEAMSTLGPWDPGRNHKGQKVATILTLPFRICIE